MEKESHDESDFVSDDYSHLDPEIFYTVTRVPGKNVSESMFSYFQSGCDCLDLNCTVKNNCSCLKYGANYKSTDTGLVLEADKFGNVPIFECNIQCSCFKDVCKREFCKEIILKSCSNRCVQFGPIDSLEIFNAGPKGLGLKTNQKIPSGSFICEYAGEVIALEEAKKRQKNVSLNGKMNYIFILKEFTGNNLSSVTCVDPTFIGNIGRYINHSCQPNSAIVPVRVNNEVPWLCVFALRDIEKDEEICYDYSGCKENISLVGEVVNQKLCFCGTVSCKKFLPFEAEI